MRVKFARHFGSIMLINVCRETARHNAIAFGVRAVQHSSRHESPLNRFVTAVRFARRRAPATMKHESIRYSTRIR